MQQRKQKEGSQKHIQKYIVANQLQSILDKAIFSNKGYSVLYKYLDTKLKKSQINRLLLPNPTSIRSIQKLVSKEVIHVLGDPFHIEDTYMSFKGDVVFNTHNKVFYNLEVL